MARCCCGRIKDLEDDDDAKLIINDIMHESIEKEGGFCGTVVKHDLRDALAELATLKREVVSLIESHDRIIKSKSQKDGEDIYYSEYLPLSMKIRTKALLKG